MSHALVALAGDRVSGIRVGVALGKGSPEFYRAVLKVNRGDRITDNFDHGRSGNLLADVDACHSFASGPPVALYPCHTVSD